VLLLVLLIGRSLDELQKIWIARPRPDLQPHLVVVKTLSFPSGHAANSMIFGLTLSVALISTARRRRIAVALSILFSLLVGTSRIMLGVHWPSDVVGGWAFGMLWVLISLPRAQRLFGGDSPARPEPL